MSKQIGQNIGFVFGKASHIVNGPVKDQVDTLSSRVSKFEQQNISQDVKTKWNGVKKAGETVNGAMTVIVQPLMNVINSVTKSVGTAFNNSENTVIKSIRQYSHSIQQTLSQGQRKGRQESKKDYEVITPANDTTIMSDQVKAVNLR